MDTGTQGKIVRRRRADLESMSTADLVDVADALGERHPGLTTGERLLAAHQLFKEISRRLRSGGSVAFVGDADGDMVEIDIAHIENLLETPLAKGR